MNVRHPRDFEGDLAAQIGSVKLGEKRLAELIKEFGVETVPRQSPNLDAAETRRGKSSAGRRHLSRALLDDDGRGNVDIAIRAKVTVKGNEMKLIWPSLIRKSSFINSSSPILQSAVVMAYASARSRYRAERRHDSTAFRQDARRNIIWAKPGAPVSVHIALQSGNHRGDRRCLAPACPERAMAGWENGLGSPSKAKTRGTVSRSFGMFHARQAPRIIGRDGWHGSGEWHSAGG